MPVEAKPLFRPDVLRSHLQAFALPDVDRSKLKSWASDIAERRIDRHGEKAILAHFLNDVFVELLGYAPPTCATSTHARSSRCRPAPPRL
jgi:hypothetical protein